MSNARSRQLAYFKDNIQDDQDEFDASRYYYSREDQILAGPPGSISGPASSLPFTSTLSGTSGVYGTHSPAGFAPQAARALPIPQMAPQTPMTFAPSSDLLAMLSRGVSLGSTDLSASTSSQSIPDGFNSDLLRQSVGSGGHTTRIPCEAVRETRRVPFDMSDFPALAGRVSLPHGAPRDTLIDVPTLNLPCDSGNSIERDPTMRVDNILTSAELHGFPQNVLTNEHLTERALAARSTHEYNLESGSTFAMQSEDFPALPGSQVAAIALSSNDECVANDGVSSVHVHQDIVPQGPNHAESKTKLPRECDVLVNQGAVLKGITLSSTPDTELISSIPRSLQANKSSVASMAPVLASSNVGTSAVAVARCTLSTSSFDRVAENHSEMLLDPTSAPRDVCTFGNVSERSGTSPSLDVLDVGLTARVPNNKTIQTSKKNGNADAEKQTKYGLLGLLDVIRMTNADLNTLALGSDLTTLGLNLNSSECLYSTFASPWAEAPTTREPQFSLPLCYYMQPPPLKTSHLSKFQLETLFYIFYAMPKDVLQAYSAQELYNREWQYHQDLKLWFKRGSAADGLSVSSNQYIYFDIKTWECRLFSNLRTASNLTSGLLHEDSVRVKFMTSS